MPSAAAPVLPDRMAEGVVQADRERRRQIQPAGREGQIVAKPPAPATRSRRRRTRSRGASSAIEESHGRAPS